MYKTIDNLKKECDIWLEEYFKNKDSYNKRVYESMYYSIAVGGKRIRPILMLLSYSIYKEDCDYKDILPIACAMEMIHTYSLIHDDLPCMDNDDLRRGKPTNHKVFGEDVAVLAGDALLNEAMNIMFSYCKDANKDAIKACKLISQSSGAEGMIGGQLVDILSEGKKISTEELYYMHRKKTGELIKSSVMAGAILGGAPDTDVELLEKYGEKLGIAFQIKDDILDVIGNSKLLGKNVKSDENNNKTTFISIYGLDKCKEMCETLTNECIEILESINRNTDELKELTYFLMKREF